MKTINNYIQEKFLINKNTKIDYKLDDEKRKDIYLPNTKITFPVILNIAEQQIECVYYTLRQSNQGTYFYDLYDKNSDKILSMSESNVIKLFDEKRTITNNTKLGWTTVKYIK